MSTKTISMRDTILVLTSSSFTLHKILPGIVTVATGNLLTWSIFLESIVMLIGGRTAGNRRNFKPWFFSLNPTLVPLPACLTGSKTNIDRIRRHHAPLIIGQGIMLAKFYRWNVMQGNLITTCNLVFLSDGKPLMCGGAANNRECHSYEGPFQIVL